MSPITWILGTIVGIGIYHYLTNKPKPPVVYKWETGTFDEKWTKKSPKEKQDMMDDINLTLLKKRDELKKGGYIE